MLFQGLRGSGAGGGPRCCDLDETTFHLCALPPPHTPAKCRRYHLPLLFHKVIRGSDPVTKVETLRRARGKQQAFLQETRWGRGLGRQRFQSQPWPWFAGDTGHVSPLFLRLSFLPYETEMPAVHTTRKTKIKPRHKPLHKQHHQKPHSKKETNNKTKSKSPFPKPQCHGTKDTAQPQERLRPLLPSSSARRGSLPSQKLLAGGQCPTNNHRETTTGSTHAWRDGVGGEENVVGQKTGGKIHQGKRTTLRAAVWAFGGLGATQAPGQAPRGSGSALPMGPSMPPPGSQGTGGRYEINGLTVLQETSPPAYTLGTKAMSRVVNSPHTHTPCRWGSRAGANTALVPISPNSHIHPCPQGWVCPLHPCCLIAAGGWAQGGDPHGKPSSDPSGSAL